MNAIHLRANILALFLALLSGCAGNQKHSPDDNTDRNTRIDNLKKAVQLPWIDDGGCVVREAFNKWPVVVERCFYALDLQNIRFEASAGTCSVDSVDSAALGRCLLAAVPAVETSVAVSRFAGPRMAAFPLAAVPFVVAPATPVLVAAGVIVVGGLVGVLIFEAIEDYLEDASKGRAEPKKAAPQTLVEVSPKLDPKLHPSPKNRLGPDIIPLPHTPDPETHKNKKKPGRIYVTYTKFNNKNKLYYSGRASMVIDLNKPHRLQALEAVDERDRNHHIEDNNFEPNDFAFDSARLDEFDVGTAVNYEDRYRDLAYWRIRGREQQLIDRHGGAWSDTGKPYKTENAKRGVARDHKRAWEFHKAATDKWGEINKYTGEQR